MPELRQQRCREIAFPFCRQTFLYVCGGTGRWWIHLKHQWLLIAVAVNALKGNGIRHDDEFGL